MISVKIKKKKNDRTDGQEIQMLLNFLVNMLNITYNGGMMENNVLSMRY